MVTERQYNNALNVIKKYKEEQIALKKQKLQEDKITLGSKLTDLYLKGFISTRLYSLLKNYHKQYVLVYDTSECSLEFFMDINQLVFRRWRNVGPSTLQEFVDLMAAAGHVVPKD